MRVGPAILEEMLCVGRIGVIATRDLEPVAYTATTRGIPRPSAVSCSTATADAPWPGAAPGTGSNPTTSTPTPETATTTPTTSPPCAGTTTT
jgi:hypothetical protein